MKHTLHVLPLLFAASMTNAQLVNGSFEIDGQPSLEGWNNSCGEAISLPGGAPGSGDWHVGYPMHDGLAVNCNGSFDVLFQEIPWLIPENQQLTIGFWSRTPMDLNMEYFFGIECRLSFIDAEQVFSPLLNSGGPVAPTTEWTYHTVQGTVHAFQPDQPRAIGFAGYDTSGTNLFELDGVEILSIEEGSTGIGSISPAKVLGYHDPNNEVIIISKPLDGALFCFDASGCHVEVPLTGARTFDTTSLAPGIYTAVAGQRVLRFVKQ